MLAMLIDNLMDSLVNINHLKEVVSQNIIKMSRESIFCNDTTTTDVPSFDQINRITRMSIETSIDTKLDENAEVKGRVKLKEGKTDTLKDGCSNISISEPSQLQRNGADIIKTLRLNLEETLGCIKYLKHSVKEKINNSTTINHQENSYSTGVTKDEICLHNSNDLKIGQSKQLANAYVTKDSGSLGRIILSEFKKSPDEEEISDGHSDSDCSVIYIGEYKLENRVPQTRTVSDLSSLSVVKEENTAENEYLVTNNEGTNNVEGCDSENSKKRSVENSCDARIRKKKKKTSSGNGSVQESGSANLNDIPLEAHVADQDFLCSSSAGLRGDEQLKIGEPSDKNHVSHREIAELDIFQPIYRIKITKLPAHTKYQEISSLLESNGVEFLDLLLVEANDCNCIAEVCFADKAMKERCLSLRKQLQLNGKMIKMKECKP